MTYLAQLQQSGIRRRGSPKSGFRYVDAHGKKPDAATLERIRSMVLPPAWTDVYIDPDPKAHLQAVGRDKAGRWQYRYHPDFTQNQAKQKYDRLVEFANALPKMRATVDRDLRRHGLGREKVMACILKILSTVFIRPGSQSYAAENGSYGVATLRRKHVKVKGDVVHFSFPGKSGKQQERELKNRQVARIVRQLLATPGHEVFKYIDADGKIVDVRRRDINQYIKEVMGERFSAKDFRTWAGTLIAACALARAGVDQADSKTSRKKKVVQAVKEAAAILGNTPSVCRSSYIYPSVLSSFDRGRVVEKYFDTVEELAEHRRHSLHASERALLALLKEEAKSAPARAARRRRQPSERPRARSRKAAKAPRPRRATKGDPRGSATTRRAGQR